MPNLLTDSAWLTQRQACKLADSMDEVPKYPRAFIMEQSMGDINYSPSWCPLRAESVTVELEG